MSTKYSKLFFVWVFATLVPGAPSIVAEESESAGFSTERLGLLDKSMQGYVDRKQVAGAVALVARRGKVVYHKSFGYRDSRTHPAWPASSEALVGQRLRKRGARLIGRSAITARSWPKFRSTSNWGHSGSMAPRPMWSGG